MMRRILIVCGLILGMGILNVTPGQAEDVFVTKDVHIVDTGTAPGFRDGIPDGYYDIDALLVYEGLTNDIPFESRAILTFNLTEFAGLDIESAVLKGYGFRLDAEDNEPIAVRVLGGEGTGQIELSDFNAEKTLIDTFELNPIPDAPIVVLDWQQFDVNVTEVVQTLISESEDFVEFRLESDQFTAQIHPGEILEEFQGLGNFDEALVPVLEITVSEEQPICGDLNDDGILDLADAIALLNFLFLGGADLQCR